MTLQRIEDALERLEAAAKQSTPGLAQLQANNVKLREAVVMSLSQIDALIARHGTEPQA